MTIAKAPRVITIDCNYITPQYACAYLLIEEEKAVFVENNTQFAVPRLIATLEDQGLTPEDVQYIIITHVHLDHAGGTAALAKRCPNATVLAQQRAARHIIDPERLIKGATAVYGEEKFNAMYGAIEPVPEERVRAVEDGERIKFGSRAFYFFHTLGHAKHHMCIYDSASKGVFSGDAFGLCFPALQTGTHPFIFPSTTPPDFDPAEAIRSIEKIVDTEAEVVYLTHFGPFHQVKEGAQSMTASLQKIEIMLQLALQSQLEGPDLDQFCLQAMMEYFDNEVQSKQIRLTPEMRKMIEGDIYLNAQGLSVAVQKQREANARD